MAKRISVHIEKEGKGNIKEKRTYPKLFSNCPNKFHITKNIFTQKRRQYKDFSHLVFKNEKNCITLPLDYYVSI